MFEDMKCLICWPWGVALDSTSLMTALLQVLDAPALQDDFYLNLVDWSSQNMLAVGLGPCVYLWSACTSKVRETLYSLDCSRVHWPAGCSRRQE